MTYELNIRKIKSRFKRSKIYRKGRIIHNMRNSGQVIDMYMNADEFNTFEEKMENITKTGTILQDHVILPDSYVEFDAFCERLRLMTSQNSVLCG